MGKFSGILSCLTHQVVQISKLSGRTRFGCNLRVFFFGCEEFLEGHLKYVKLMINNTDALYRK